jgi:putative transcriptional regulator
VAIEIRLDVMLARRKISLTELAARVGVSITNLSLLKTGKVKSIRFATLEALCRELRCQPGDLLEHVPESIWLAEATGAGLGESPWTTGTPAHWPAWPSSPPRARR